MIKIAIIGKICSGKTTIINKLLELKEYNFKVYNFGDYVKKYIYEIFDINIIENMLSKKAIKNSESFYINNKPRKLIQDFAENMKILDNDVWIKLLKKDINKHISRDISNIIIVGDVRFYNEYQMLKDLGFIFIKLDINKDLQIERIKNTYPNNYQEHLERLEHISEINIDNFKYDYIIDVNNDLEIIINQLNIILRIIFNKK